MNPPTLQKHLNDRAWRALSRARQYCEKQLTEVQVVADDFLAKRGLKPEEVCCVVVGSVGRQEALEASDIDLTPVLRSAAALTAFQPHDKDLRNEIQTKLKTKVSQGDDLTKCVSLEELIDPESIGGECLSHKWGWDG